MQRLTQAPNIAIATLWADLLCKDGSVAPDNAALVRQAVEAATALGRPLATAADIRQRFGAA